MEIINRYELRIGKFGYYFYDNTLDNNMALSIILDRLNYYHKSSVKKAKLLNEQTREIEKLTTELRKYT